MTASQRQLQRVNPDNCPPVRVGVSVKVRVSFRVEEQSDNCPGAELPSG